MTDEKYRNYIVNEGLREEYHDNLYDILEYWKNNPGFVDCMFTYKNVKYIIRIEGFPVPERGKPYISYYLKHDWSDEHITYFDSFEEMFENYHLQDGTLLLDFFTNPIYGQY